MTVDPSFDLAVALRVFELSVYSSDTLSAALDYGLRWPTPDPTAAITVAALEHLLMARGEGKALLPAPWYPGSVAETK